MRVARRRSVALSSEMDVDITVRTWHCRAFCLRRLTFRRPVTLTWRSWHPCGCPRAPCARVCHTAAARALRCARTAVVRRAADSPPRIRHRRRLRGRPRRRCHRDRRRRRASQAEGAARRRQALLRRRPRRPRGLPRAATRHEEQLASFRASIKKRALLSPADQGAVTYLSAASAWTSDATSTVSEMVFARFLLRRNPVEKARLRRHPSEKLFGVQLRDEPNRRRSQRRRLAAEAGADFIDLNCGCPIHETWKRGLGAALLKKPKKLERLVRGIAEGVPLPLTVKIRLGVGELGRAPVHQLAEGGGARGRRRGGHPRQDQGAEVHARRELGTSSGRYSARGAYPWSATVTS